LSFLQKAFTALTASALLIPIGTQAVENIDTQSYWYGFFIGSAAMTCAFLEDGLITRAQAKETLIEIFSKDPEIPEVSRKAALKEMVQDKQNKSCPLPPR